VFALPRYDAFGPPAAAFPQYADAGFAGTDAFAGAAGADPESMKKLLKDTFLEVK